MRILKSRPKSFKEGGNKVLKALQEVSVREKKTSRDEELFWGKIRKTQ